MTARRSRSIATAALAPMTILVDTREQLPYNFTGLHMDPSVDPLEREIGVARATLAAGDYSIAGHEHGGFALERKSLADAYSTFTTGRERFERELERGRVFEYFGIVVEATWRGMNVPPPHVERVKPATVIKSLLSWSIDYGVHVFAADDREIGRALVFRLAERFWRKKNLEGRMPESPDDVLIAKLKKIDDDEEDLDLSDFEAEFMDSMLKRLREGRTTSLTPKQRAVAEQIVERYGKS